MRVLQGRLLPRWKAQGRRFPAGSRSDGRASGGAQRPPGLAIAAARGPAPDHVWRTSVYPCPLPVTGLMTKLALPHTPGRLHCESEMCYRSKCIFVCPTFRPRVFAVPRYEHQSDGRRGDRGCCAPPPSMSLGFAFFFQPHDHFDKGYLQGRKECTSFLSLVPGKSFNTPWHFREDRSVFVRLMSDSEEALVDGDVSWG